MKRPAWVAYLIPWFCNVIFPTRTMLRRYEIIRRLRAGLPVPDRDADLFDHLI